MEITVEKLIDKYNEHRKLVEENTKNIESIQMDLDEVEEAIEAIEEFGGLLDFIKVLEEAKKREKLIEKLQKYDKKIQSIYNEYNDTPDYISNRNTSKNIKELDEIIEFGKNIKELMEENKVSDLNSKEEVLKVLNKYKDEFNEEIKKSQEQIDASMSLIDNIKKVSEEKIIDVTNDDKTRKQEIEFGIKEIEPLIGEMQNLEMELSRYAFFRAEGILTHTQTLQINSIINRQKVLTGEFSRKMGFNQEGAPAFAVIDSMTMANMYYARKKDLEQAERIIDAPVQTQKLNNLVKDVDATLNKFNKDAEAEKEEKLTFKNLVIYGNAISKIENNDFVLVQPTTENKPENVIVEPVVVTVETSQKKPKEEQPVVDQEQVEEQQPSSLENEEKPKFSFILDEPKPSIYDDVEVEPKKNDDNKKPAEVESTPENPAFSFKIDEPSMVDNAEVEETPIEEEIKPVGAEPIHEESEPFRFIPPMNTENPTYDSESEEPISPEYVDNSNDFEQAINNNENNLEVEEPKSEKPSRRLSKEELEMLSSVMKEIIKDDETQYKSYQPKESIFKKAAKGFSNIAKKIKRKVTSAEFLKNRTDALQSLEAGQNSLETEERDHTL